MYDYRTYLRKRLYTCFAYTALLIVFVGSMYFAGHYFQNQKQLQCDQSTLADFNEMVNSICLELSNCKLPAVKRIQELQQDTSFHFQNEEEVYTSLEQLMKDNPIISGAIMGFEDWVYPQYANHNGFGALVRRVGDELSRIQIGEFRDFRAENEWYQHQLQDPVAEWSKPFLSDDGEMIATYTMPLFKNNRYMGGFGIDIDLSRFADHINTLRPYPSSIVVVVDSELNILIHPNHSYIGTTKLTDAMHRVGINPDIHPMHHSKDQQSGVDYDYLGQRRMAFYYAPINETNWMVLLYCNTDEIYAPAVTLHGYIMIFTIIGGLFLAALLVISIFRYFSDYYRFKQSLMQ